MFNAIYSDGFGFVGFLGGLEGFGFFGGLAGLDGFGFFGFLGIAFTQFKHYINYLSIKINIVSRTVTLR